MDGVNNAFCSSKEEYEIARLTTKCAGLQGKIESQAAEIGVLKIAHEAHQTSNLKMLAVLKKQNAEIEKYKALCDQLGNALEEVTALALCGKKDQLPGRCDQITKIAYKTLKTWRAMK